jgi:predicted alpha/beta-fold hydrolase
MAFVTGEWSPAVVWVVFVLVLAVVSFSVYVRLYVRVPGLHFVDTDRNRRLLGSLPALRARFWPTFWFAHGFLQSFVSHYRKSPRLLYERELVRCRDGERVALDWYRGRPPSPSASQSGSAAADDPESADAERRWPSSTPIVIILHGIAGNSSESNTQILAQRIRHTARFRAVVFNRRGCALGLKLTVTLLSPFHPSDRPSRCRC